LVLLTSAIPSIRNPLSTPLTMSHSVSAATLTAVKASISTPVRAVIDAVASMRSRSGPARWNETLTASSGSVWHSGTR